MMPKNVDTYLREGCGRCELHATPACKVHRWKPVLMALRELVLASGLKEEVKWGSPCYTLAGKNVVMVSAFKEHCALLFFKGAALVDETGVLESPGPSSRFARCVKFASLEQVKARLGVTRALVDQAIVLERSGKKIVPDKSASESVPPELARRLATDPTLARAFAALTPGRRRSHILHVAGAKQSDTRERRIDRCTPNILAGRGMNER